MGTAIKKGDKFRVNMDCRSGGYRNGDVFKVSRPVTSGVFFFDRDGRSRHINYEHVTFVDDFGDPWDYKPALKIEAGKFYRTRDGRKVGPAVRRDYWWAIDGKVYGADGTHGDDWDDKAHLRVAPNQPAFDLIAEWTEPKAKGCAAAEVDNLRDEYGPVAAAPAEPESKFKVGDRVRVVVGEEDAGSGHGAEVGEEHIVTEVTSDGADTEPWYFFNEEVELAPELDTTPSINITADTSELDAEIDRIKRKLKKLSKKARKLGISLDYDLAA